MVLVLVYTGACTLFLSWGFHCMKHGHAALRRSRLMLLQIKNARTRCRNITALEGQDGRCLSGARRPDLYIRPGNRTRKACCFSRRRGDSGQYPRAPAVVPVGVRVLRDGVGFHTVWGFLFYELFEVVNRRLSLLAAF